MKLSNKFLKNLDRDVVIQYFDKNWSLHCEQYDKKDIKHNLVNKDLFDMEVMETTDEDDCMVVWLR